MPASIGPYTILGELGRGGMGVVYRAHRADLKKDYALKVILPGQDASVDAVARFRREALAAAQLGTHPGIVACHDIGEADGKVYFAMDFVEGTSLEELIDAGELTHRRAAELTAQAARALHFAHAHGVVHRDVKPANLLVTPDGRGLVADFGLAMTQETGPEGHRLTQSGMVMGTPAYMPPEQARGTLTLDARADVYALGAGLYECLVGRPPFVAESTIGLLTEILHTEPKPPRKRDPRVPKDLDTIVLKCLEKDPDRRYPSADALAADLTRWCNDEPIAARPPSGLERLRRSVRRHRLAWGVGAVAVVALLAVVIGFGLRLKADREREFRATLERIVAQSAKRNADLELARQLAESNPDGALAVLDRLVAEAPSFEGAAAEVRERAAAARVELARRRAVASVSRPLADADRRRADHDASLAKLTALERTDAEARLKGGASPVTEELRRTQQRLDEHYVVAQAAYLSVREGLREYPAADELRRATEGLAALAWSRLERAESVGAWSDATRFEQALREYDGELESGGRSPYAERLEGTGTLTLDTEPSGAAVTLHRFESTDGTMEPRPVATEQLRTPLRAHPLPMGSYLLVIRAPGKRDTRYPIVIGRSAHRRIEQPVRLLSDAEIGDGYVWVAGGASRLGGDPVAFNPWPRHVRQVPGFCMGAHEVTAGEYRAFLQALLDGGEPEAAVGLRIPRQSKRGDYLWAARAGRIVTPPGAPMDWPVFGISWDDAQAYCAWRSKVEGRRVRLPSEAEWERAARGADGRLYPWGDGVPWTRAACARSPLQGNRVRPLPVGAAAGDVSPFGVHDLAGSVWEWCKDTPPDVSRSRAVRGGSWSGTDLPSFRAATRTSQGEPRVDIQLGFRVCAEPKTR
jgi:formylglycine-generating enzyme required for sulfatase activity